MKHFKLIALLLGLFASSMPAQSTPPSFPDLGGAPDPADSTYIWDASASALKEMTIANLITYTDTLYQAKDTDLAIYAGITPSANVQVILAAANYAAVRAALGLDTGDSPTFAGITLTTAAVGTTNTTTFQIGGVTVTPTAAELNYVDGVTSAIQTQLDTKASASIVTKHTSTNYTIGTTSALELKGGVIYVSGACTLTIPAVSNGDSFTVITIGAVAVSVDPNASDLIVLDGTALSDGDKVTNTSTTGDIIVFTYYDGTGWYATSSGWTDGN